MTSGLPNDEKARIRQQFAKGEIGRDRLLQAEMASYHGPGTCTFYGTANTNQMLMEFMGLHLPGTSFVNPGDELRDALTAEAARRALAITAGGNELYAPACVVLDERAFVNGMVGLSCHRRVDQSGAASGGHGAGGRGADRLAGHGRDVGRHAADGAGLSQRAGGREPLPRRRAGWAYLIGELAGGRAPARAMCAPWPVTGLRRYTQEPKLRRRGDRSGPPAGTAPLERHDPAPGLRAVPADRRARAARRQSRARG